LAGNTFSFHYGSRIAADRAGLRIFLTGGGRCNLLYMVGGMLVVVSSYAMSA